MNLFSKTLLITITISLFQMVIIPNILKSVFFKSSTNNVQKIRIKAVQICNENRLWGQQVEENSIISLLCEIDKN